MRRVPRLPRAPRGSPSIQLAGRPSPPAARAAPPAPAAGPPGRAFGHDLARFPIGPPRQATGGSAPIQLLKWKWNATTKAWSPADGSTTTAIQPAHPGLFEGHVYDDGAGTSYSQASDATVKPFLRTGESFMGERGARKQLKGIKPTSDEIRVTAVKQGDLRGGSGLHEIVPTNLGGEVASSGSKILPGLQSGMRSSTSRQLFRRKPVKGEKGTVEVGAHTGFAPKLTARGSTHTKGQGPAHDKLRETVRKKSKSQKDPYEAVNELGLTHTESMPTGPEVLESKYISGMVPSSRQFGTIGSSSTDPSRIKLAQHQHLGRERTKKRLRSLKRHAGRGKSPSPPREDISDTGGGGDYTKLAPIDYPLSPVPDFDGTDLFEYTSNVGSWLSQPNREGFELGTPLTLPTLPHTTTTPTTTLSTPAPTPVPTTTLSTPVLGGGTPPPRRNKRKTPPAPNGPSSSPPGKRRWPWSRRRR